MGLPHPTHLQVLLLLNACLALVQVARAGNLSFNLMVEGKKNRRHNLSELVAALALVWLLCANIGYLWALCGNACRWH